VGHGMTSLDGIVGMLSSAMLSEGTLELSGGDGEHFTCCMRMYLGGGRVEF